MLEKYTRKQVFLTHLGISSVIFAVLAGGQLFGFMGILLALPVASVLAVLLRHARQRYRESEFYGEAEETAEE